MESKIQVETLSTIQKKFIVTIPAARVTQRVETQFNEVQKTAKLKGFRPGKVPLPLVKQFYNDDVKHRVLHSLIDEGYREALKKHPLRVVGEPRVEGKDEPEHLHIHEGEDLEFVAIVDVIPEVEPKDYKGLSVTKGKVEVTEDEVTKAKNSFLERKAELLPITRAANKGDFADFKYEGQLETENGFETLPELSGNLFFEIGSGEILAQVDEALVGMKPGETKNIDFTYEKDYSDAKFAGKKAKFEIVVRELKEKNLPELTDELAKEFGYESIADFDGKIREYLLKSKEQSIESNFRNDLIQKLVEKNTFEVPERLVYQQVRVIAEDYASELRRYGFNDKMLENAVASQLEDFKKRAEVQVRAGVLLDAIAKKEKIIPTKEDLENEMKTLSKEERTTVERSPRDRLNFEYRVREELVIQFLTKNAKVK